MSFFVQLTDDSSAARCLELLERHCPRLMKEGGGSLSPEYLSGNQRKPRTPMTESEALQYATLIETHTPREIGLLFNRNVSHVSRHLHRLGRVVDHRRKVA